MKLFVPLQLEFHRNFQYYRYCTVTVELDRINYFAGSTVQNTGIENIKSPVPINKIRKSLWNFNTF